MPVLHHFLATIDRQTIAVSLLAVLSTALCLHFDFTVEMPLELVGIAIVFPIVFSISQAFQRREAALFELAELRANLTALYFGHRDWPTSGDHASACRALIGELQRAVRASLAGSDRRERAASAGEVQRLFSTLASRHAAWRRDGVVSEGDLGNLGTYLRHAMRSVEKMRNIANYRTPQVLRAYTQVFLNSFPVLFGPYFAWVGASNWVPLGFGVAVLYALVLVGLDNIQEELENPFDGIGADDVDWDDAFALDSGDT